MSQADRLQRTPDHVKTAKRRTVTPCDPAEDERKKKIKQQTRQLASAGNLDTSTADDGMDAFFKSRAKSDAEASARASRVEAVAASKTVFRFFDRDSGRSYLRQAIVGETTESLRETFFRKIDEIGIYEPEDVPGISRQAGESLVPYLCDSAKGAFTSFLDIIRPQPVQLCKKRQRPEAVEVFDEVEAADDEDSASMNDNADEREESEDEEYQRALAAGDVLGSDVESE